MPDVCSICEDFAPDGELCRVCSGLLRWIRGYFEFLPDRDAYITPTTHFINNLACDSLDLMFWPLEIEEKLGVRITNAQAERLLTVAQMISFLREVGAEWPDDCDLKLLPRRWCISGYYWNIIKK